MIHLDADIAPDLGRAEDCVDPPAWSDGVRQEVRDWLGGRKPDNVVVTVPCLRTETWVYAALVKRPFADLECNPTVDDYLARIGLQAPSRRGKHRKRVHRYRQTAPKVAARFDRVCGLCAEARRFKTRITQVADERG